MINHLRLEEGCQLTDHLMHVSGWGSDLSPVGLLNVIMAAAFLQTQDLIQRLSRGGQSSLPPLRHPGTITCHRWTRVRKDNELT